MSRTMVHAGLVSHRTEVSQDETYGTTFEVRKSSRTDLTPSKCRWICRGTSVAWAGISDASIPVQKEGQERHRPARPHDGVSRRRPARVGRIGLERERDAR